LTHMSRLPRSLSARSAFSAPWLFGAALALPTLLVRSPPMTDLPMHAGAVGLLLHWGDPTFVPPGLYWLNLGHPNQLFYAVAYVLSRLAGIRIGVGLAVALAQVGIVGGGAIFARRTGAPWWTALWLAPLALGWTYFWGLATNLYGLAFFLPAVVLVDRLVTAPTPRLSAAMAATYVLLFFAHETALGAALGVHLLFFALRSPRRAPASVLAPAAFAVTLVFGHILLIHRIHTAAERGFVGDVLFGDLLPRVVDLPATIFGSYPLPIVLAMAVPCAGAAWAARRRDDGQSAMPLGSRGWDLRFVLAALGLTVAYLLAPAQLFGVTMLNARFASYAWAILLPASCAGTQVRGRSRRVALLLTGTAFVGPLLVAAPAFFESDRLNKGLDRVMERMAPGEAVLVDRLEPRKVDDLFTAVSCGRVLALQGGRCQFDFTRTSLSPVRMDERLMWSRIARRSGPNDPIDLRPAQDLRYYRYMLLWSDAVAADAPVLERTLAPYARLVVEDEGWLLFESKLPRVAPNVAEIE
jgi:hypothetical protein